LYLAMVVALDRKPPLQAFRVSGGACHQMMA